MTLYWCRRNWWRWSQKAETAAQRACAVSESRLVSGAATETYNAASRMNISSAFTEWTIYCQLPGRISPPSVNLFHRRQRCQLELRLSDVTSKMDSSTISLIYCRTPKSGSTITGVASGCSGGSQNPQSSGVAKGGLMEVNPPPLPQWLDQKIFTM